jgi:nucleoside-diphosphate-sugar epimerase
MKNILVTGGAGYVGAVLVPKLLKKGYRVTVLDLFLYANETLFNQSDNLKLVVGDLRDEALVKRTLKGIDCVIHLAGISNDPSSDLDPELTREVNINATERLIEFCKEAKIQRFINASSSSVYGIKDEPEVTEDLPLEPLTVYSESKVAIENYLREHRGNMTAVSIRSATVCGFSPRMRLDLTVNILTHHAVLKNKITVFGGIQKRPNIHIQDITDLYAFMITAPAEKIDGKEFNVCGSNATVMELAELVQETVAPHSLIEVVPTNDLRSYHISSDKIKKELGFSATHSVGEAIQEVAKAFKEKVISQPELDCYYNVKTMKRVLAA